MKHPRELLKQLGTRPKDFWSQNFLISEKWAHVLVDKLLEDTSATQLLEIGPGLGTLTELILKKTDKKLCAIERDPDLGHYLKQQYPSLDLEIRDAMVGDWPLKKTALISNLPYHLSSALLFKMTEQKAEISSAVLTFQEEFAERVVAKPSTRDFGSLSVIAQLEWNIIKIGKITADCFYPAPKVHSVSLMLLPKEGSLLPEQKIFFKNCFKHRRKKLLTNLREIATVPWSRFLEEQGLSENVRPEELSVPTFEALYRFFSDISHDLLKPLKK